ncbi:hypothetical protein GCM10027614_09000 [Micromonospora vulcania]
MKPRVLVAGTKFGQVYLQAFRQPDFPFELAGILAGGSARSVACARHYDVPLWTDVAQVPDDVTLACVVIRGGLLGGPGGEVARALMERGLHVLQEHPLHHDELVECLRTAGRAGVVYHLNSFYVHTAPVRRFLAAARALLARQPARYVDAACGFQVAYALLDILGQALGGVRPWGLAPPVELPEQVRRLSRVDVPFRSIDGVLAGVPLTLRVQNQMDPADPDNYAHLLHRVTIGTEAGNLTLVGTHGPTVWSPRPDFPQQVQDRGWAGRTSPTVSGPNPTTWTCRARSRWPTRSLPATAPSSMRCGRPVSGTRWATCTGRRWAGRSRPGTASTT